MKRYKAASICTNWLVVHSNFVLLSLFKTALQYFRSSQGKNAGVSFSLTPVAAPWPSLECWIFSLGDPGSLVGMSCELHPEEPTGSQEAEERLFLSVSLIYKSSEPGLPSSRAGILSVQDLFCGKRSQIAPGSKIRYLERQLNPGRIYCDVSKPADFLSAFSLYYGICPCDSRKKGSTSVNWNRVRLQIGTGDLWGFPCFLLARMYCSADEWAVSSVWWPWASESGGELSSCAKGSWFDAGQLGFVISLLPWEFKTRFSKGLWVSFHLHVIW